MPKLATKVTTTVKQEVKITPLLKVKLRRELKTYAALYTQLAALKSAVKKQTAAIRTLREQTGENSISFEGFTTTNVPGTTAYLDKEHFVSLGGSLEMLANSTFEKPKKAYEKITVPGVKGETGDE